jgi:hypothetical protein
MTEDTIKALRAEIKRLHSIIREMEAERNYWRKCAQAEKTA